MFIFQRPANLFSWSIFMTVTFECLHFPSDDLKGFPSHDGGSAAFIFKSSVEAGVSNSFCTRLVSTSEAVFTVSNENGNLMLLVGATENASKTALKVELFDSTV